MKKIICVVFAALVSVSSMFAQVVPNADKIIEDFYRRGKYIKVIKDSQNIVYYGKETVQGFVVDEDDFSIIGGFDAHGGKIGDSADFHTRKWKMSADEDGNIIITKAK